MRPTETLKNWAQQAGQLVRTFRNALEPARRPIFFDFWAAAEQWKGGDGLAEGAQRRAVLNSWVYTAIGMIAREVSAAQFQVTRQTSVDDDPIQIANHPLEQLLRRPNPWLSRSFLWQYTTLWLELSGNAYWFVLPVAGSVAEIWPLPAHKVQVFPGNAQRFVDYYQYEANGALFNIPAEFIVHFKLPNPFDIFRGLSPLVAAMLPADADSAMARWNAVFFGRDNVMPSAIINLSSGDPNAPLDRADLESLKADLRSDYTASRRRTAITNANAISAVLLGWNPKDMDFIQGRQFTKDEIFAIYGVPGGLLDKNATEANATIADKVFKEKTIWPLLTLIAETLTAQLVIPYYGCDDEAGFNDIRQGNRLLELQEVAAAGPYLTVDEVRARYWQLPPLPAGAGAHLSAGGLGGTPEPLAENPLSVLELKKAGEEAETDLIFFQEWQGYP